MATAPSNAKWHVSAAKPVQRIAQKTQPKACKRAKTVFTARAKRTKTRADPETLGNISRKQTMRGVTCESSI